MNKRATGGSRAVFSVDTISGMLLTLTTTHQPATDLGYLLYKNPARVQSFDLNFGKAHVFYPIATSECCTAALLLDVDPVGLIRNRSGPPGEGFALQQYVNDRPYVASSFLSVAISQVFGTALSGVSKHRPELVNVKLPLVAKLSVVPCRGGEAFLRRLFEPLGYTVHATPHLLSERFTEWGNSDYFTVELSNTLTLHDLLTHLYVLIPVLDNDKHYWVGEDEVQKLLRHGGEWLARHPDRQQIVDRYLKHRRFLAAAAESALARLVDDEGLKADDTDQEHLAEEQIVERKISLNEQRLNSVLEALKTSTAKRVLDLGCSYGNLLRELLADRYFDEIVGLDVSHRALGIAADRLHLDRLPENQRRRIELIHGSLTYRDSRLSGFDAAAVAEVVEHLDPPRLAAFARVLFEFARPTTVVVTTPNVEFNVRFETLPAGHLRHKDHRFEWTRKQFQAWADDVATRFDYRVRYEAIGAVDDEVGPPTQMAIFSKIT
jgi:3' terminal RNA ribose 2'-O-methyltransferase Hen1